MPLRLLLLALAGCTVYANGLFAPFVFEDRQAIVANSRIRELWPGPFTAARPVVELSLALNYALGRLDVVGYHLLNVGLHVACGLLLFDVARRTLLLTRTAPGREVTVAWWAALAFLVHPLGTEAVTHVIGRSEVLAGLFVLATLELVLVAEAHPRGRPALWMAAVASCALGMATKPVAVTAPVAVLWLAHCVLPQPERAHISFAADRAAARAPEVPTRWPLHLGLASTWALLVYLIAAREQAGAGLGIGVAPLDYLRTQLGVTWRYFRLLVWPAGQTLDYDWPLATGWLAAEVLVPALGWLACLGLLVWLERTSRRVAAFWAGFALLALVPSSSVVPIADLVVERRMYLSVAGFAVLAGLAGAGAARRVPRLAATLAALAVAALAATTIARNQLWRDPVALWEDALAKAPAKVRIYHQLTQAYEARGDYAAAARVTAAEGLMLERLAQARPRDAQVLAALADSHARRQRLAEALALAAEAVQIAPADAAIRGTYGSMLLQMARPEEAAVQLEMAEALARGDGWVNPEVVRAIRTNLGWAYVAIGRERDALRVLRQAASEDDVSALNNLGSVLGRIGKWDEAREVLERAYARAPADANVKSNLGWVYANLGRLQEARALLEEAILEQPRGASAHGNLGWVRVRTGDAAGALRALAMAHALEPDNAWVMHMEGVAHALLGDWPLAIASFERAVALDPAFPLARENLDRARRHDPPLIPGTPR